MYMLVYAGYERERSVRTLRTISIRLPVAMIEDLKIIANKRDVPYQSLLKVFLAERIEAERKLKRAG